MVWKELRWLGRNGDTIEIVQIVITETVLKINYEILWFFQIPPNQHLSKKTVVDVQDKDINICQIENVAVLICVNLPNQFVASRTWNNINFKMEYIWFDWVINFNGMSNHCGLFYTHILRELCSLYVYIYIF